jgi:autotransporter strand-loop-strand O-heptosyltransferase
MCDTLDIEKKAIKPKINGRGTPRKIAEKYVAITCNGSALAKNWLYPNGWNIIIDWLTSLGYKVVHTSNKPATEMGVTSPNLIELASDNIFDAINLIENAEFFVGLSSGNSWLAWALDKKVAMVAGLVDPAYEFHEDRYLAYTPENTCHGCFTNTTYMWNRNPYWCPLQTKFQGKEMTTRMWSYDKAWECVRTITPDIVKETINQLIGDINTNTKRDNGLMFQQRLDGTILKQELPLEMGTFSKLLNSDVRKKQ